MYTSYGITFGKKISPRSKLEQNKIMPDEKRKKGVE